ncbi:MAG: rhodanese-like domain-containing protein, partial [Rariglobus sp.]
MSADVLNISAYKFTPLPLEQLPALRVQLVGVCAANRLRGTILLSTEGINLFVAGLPENIAALVTSVRTIAGLEDFAPKESFSGEPPFNRMLVKIKKEIIAFGVDGIDPSKRTAPKLPAKTLKQWLDEGRPVTLLDTRNDYEVRMGTFRGAVPAGVDNFRNFPAAVGKLPEELKKQPIVMFCTGGIRCEKAGPFMEREGFEQVFQLDGGILKYFEECGGAHYDGECFVFDRRVGVDSQLKETGSVMCWKCQMPLTVEDQKDPRYLYEKSC